MTPQSKLAEEDIPVFKIVKRNLTAYYRNFHYSIGEVFKTEISVPMYSPCKVFYIEEGFHSYSNQECKTAITETLSEPIITVFHMFHGELYRLDAYMDACILECVIPKGSIYYLNHKGEYVSNKIKPVKVKCVG
jgi:hypothetical protein